MSGVIRFMSRIFDKNRIGNRTRDESSFQHVRLFRSHKSAVKWISFVQKSVPRIILGNYLLKLNVIVSNITFSPRGKGSKGYELQLRSEFHDVGNGSYLDKTFVYAKGDNAFRT